MNIAKNSLLIMKLICKSYECFVAKLGRDADVVGSFVVEVDFLGGSPLLFLIQRLLVSEL